MFKVKNGTLGITDEFKPTIRNALDLSIAKWEFILEHLKTWGVIIHDGGTATCGLCFTFRCTMCPISVVRDSGCDDTPHADYLSAETLEEHIAAAKAELEFLKGVRK